VASVTCILGEKSSNTKCIERIKYTSHTDRFCNQIILTFKARKHLKLCHLKWFLLHINYKSQCPDRYEPDLLSRRYMKLFKMSHIFFIAEDGYDDIRV
jgi:hypothetical protein